MKSLKRKVSKVFGTKDKAKDDPNIQVDESVDKLIQQQSKESKFYMTHIEPFYQSDCFQVKNGSNKYLESLNFKDLKKFINSYFLYCNDLNNIGIYLPNDIINVILMHYNSYEFLCLDPLFAKIIVFNRIYSSQAVTPNQFIFGYHYNCTKTCSYCLQIGIFIMNKDQASFFINNFHLTNTFTHSKFHQLLSNKQFLNKFEAKFNNKISAFYLTFQKGMNVSFGGLNNNDAIQFQYFVGKNKNDKINTLKNVPFNSELLTVPNGILQINITQSNKVEILKNKYNNLEMEQLYTFDDCIKFDKQNYVLLPAIAVTGCDRCNANNTDDNRAGFNFHTLCVKSQS